MEKIKKKREYYFGQYSDEYTWKQVKERCEAKDDYILDTTIYFIYYEEETDEEYERRIKFEKLRNAFKEKQEYKLYLKLKEKYDNCQRTQRIICNIA